MYISLKQNQVYKIKDFIKPIKRQSLTKQMRFCSQRKPFKKLQIYQNQRILTQSNVSQGSNHQQMKRIESQRVIKQSRFSHQMQRRKQDQINQQKVDKLKRQLDKIKIISKIEQTNVEKKLSFYHDKISLLQKQNEQLKKEKRINTEKFQLTISNQGEDDIIGEINKMKVIIKQNQKIMQKYLQQIDKKSQLLKKLQQQIQKYKIQGSEVKNEKKNLIKKQVFQKQKQYELIKNEQQQLIQRLKLDLRKLQYELTHQKNHCISLQTKYNKLKQQYMNLQKIESENDQRKRTEQKLLKKYKNLQQQVQFKNIKVNQMILNYQNQIHILKDKIQQLNKNSNEQHLYPQLSKLRVQKQILFNQNMQLSMKLQQIRSTLSKISQDNQKKDTLINNYKLNSIQLQQVLKQQNKKLEINFINNKQYYEKQLKIKQQQLKKLNKLVEQKYKFKSQELKQQLDCRNKQIKYNVLTHNQEQTNTHKFSEALNQNKNKLQHAYLIQELNLEQNKIQQKLKDQIQFCRKKDQQKKHIIQKLQKTINENKKMSEQKNENEKILKKQLHQIRLKLIDSLAIIQKLKEEKIGLQWKLDTSEKKFKQINTFLQKKQQICNLLQSKFKQIKQNREKIQSQIITLTQTINSKNKQITKLQIHLKQYQHQLQKQTALIKVLNTKRIQYQNQVDIKFNRLKIQMHQSQQKTQSRILNYKNQLKQKQIQIKKLNQNILLLKKDINELEQQCLYQKKTKDARIMHNLQILKPIQVKQFIQFCDQQGILIQKLVNKIIQLEQKNNSQSKHNHINRQQKYLFQNQIKTLTMKISELQNNKSQNQLLIIRMQQKFKEQNQKQIAQFKQQYQQIYQKYQKYKKILQKQKQRKQIQRAIIKDSNNFTDQVVQRCKKIIK